MGFDGSPDYDFPVDSGRYIGVDDQIMVLAVSNAATQSVTVRGRLCRKDGTLTPFTFTFTTGAAAAVLTKSFQLADGFLESLQVSSPACATSGQWLYASVGLQRGTGAGAVPFETLFADYVGSVISTGWPGGALNRPTEGHGVVRSIAVATPAPGANWVVTVPTGVLWIPQYGIGTLTTSAVAGNREVGTQISDGANTLWSQAIKWHVPASSVATIQYQGSAPIDTMSLVNYDCFWPLGSILPSGYILSSYTPGIDVADQFSGVRLSVLEWAAMQ
jgi:hypothetical protein